MNSTLFLHGLRHGNTPFPYALRVARLDTHSSLEFFDGDTAQPPYAGAGENPQTVNRVYHTHDHYQISLCTEGSSDYIINNQLIHVECGDILCINLNVPHTWYSIKAGCFLHIGFYPNSLNYNTFCARLAPYINLLYSQYRPFLLIPAGTPANAAVYGLMKDIEDIHGKKMPCYDALVHNRIVDITMYLVLFFVAVNAKDISEQSASSVIQKAIAYMNNNYREPITVNTVAEHIGMNSDYFSHYFKEKMGIACKKYINFKRIEYAASLLGELNADITQVAFDSGFSSLSTFYKCFTESYHMSPSQFRQSVCHSFA